MSNTLNKEHAERLRLRLINRNEGFNMSQSEFEVALLDDNRREKLYNIMSERIPSFSMSKEEFDSNLGIVSEEEKDSSDTTTEVEQPKSNFWQSIGAHNPYPTIQKPDKEIKMSEVVRPKDYTGQSNDGSIESLLSSSFYNLSDEELSSQMNQLQKELDAPMEPVYGAFKAQTGREYDRSGKNNSHGDEVRLDNILNSMKAAELAKRGYYDANSSMRRAKIKKEVDDLFDDNSGNGKEIKERLSRLSAEKAWRERQGTGKQVMLGKALSEQQKEIQRLQESGPTNMSLRGAQKYLDDAIAEYNAPSKYGPENGFVNWAGGLGSQLSNYDTWTAGVTEMARAIDLKNIVEKMNTGKSLPPAEQAKLDAFLLYNLVQESRQEDISSAYSIGKGTAESIPFMAEMFITAGIGAAGKKLILKSLLKKGNKEAAEKIARIFGYKIDDIAEDKAKKEVTNFAIKEAKQGAIERSARQIGQDVAMTAAMPTTWTAISEDKVNKILNGEEYGFKDFLRTFAGQTIETGTEHWGGKIVDKALGSVMPLDKIWGKTRWGKIFTNDFIQSPLGETGEEYVGAAVNYIRSLNPMYSEKSNEELRAEAEHMFSPEGFTQTFLTVLPMSVLGGAGNVISHKKTISTYKKSKNNLISMLTELGATNEQAQTIFTSIEGSSDTQGFTEKLQYIVGALKTQYQEQHPDASLEEMEEYFNKLDKVVGDYYRSAYYLNELGGEIQSAIDKMDEAEKQQVKQDFENEVKQQITNPNTTEDSDKNLEVLSTGNKPIEFKINVTEETRESGKTSDVTKEVKVSFRSNAYSYANDGSIISDKFSLLANGSPLSGKKKEEYFGLINDQLRAEKAKADEKTAQERANQAQLEQEREAQAQQIAQQKAAAEQKKKQLRETTPMKEGVVDTESSKTTPAHIFLWNLDNHGQEEAIKRAARAVGESIYAKEKLEEDTKMSSTKRDAEIDRANMRIAAYEQAVKDFVGETAAQQLRQDAEGQVALLLQRDMENAKEEERVRLERIAEKQRIKEENRKLYRTNLDNQKDNNNFAQNSNDNGNNEGTNRELQEGSGNGVLETAGNGQTQSGDNQQGIEDIDSDTNAEDNGYDEAGEYRDNVLSGEVTQEKETPEEESTSQDQDTPEEVQQEPIDLTADNVVMMIQGASSTRTTYTFARHEIDEDGNDVYINLGCPFGSKSVNGNIGRKLSTKTWAVTDKSKKLFYVKDAYGTPFACYAITSEDISNKKFSRGSKLNAVVAETGEPLYGVTSMQDAYVMQGDKEVSILNDKKQHGNKIKAESIESLLKHKVVIRFASEAKGEKEISVTLYDLLYGEFASDVNNFAKAREFTNVEAENSGYGAGLYTSLLKGAIMDMAKAWNEYCGNNGLKNIKPDLSKLSQQDRDLFWFARQEMNRDNREEADKASMEVQTSVPAKTMGDSNGIYNNPLHQLGVMLYIANKLGYVQGEVFNNLPGRVRQASEGKHIITKEVIEKVRERYDALKSGKATVNLEKFETEKQEMEYYEKYYPEVLNDEPVHNRLAITDDNSRKKALKNIHDSKLREEAAKEVAKEEKKETPKDKSEKEPAAKKKESSKEKVDSNTSVLDEIVTTGFEQLEKALADGDQTKQEEIIQQLNVIIAGNAEYQDRLAKMLADAEAKKIRAEVLQKKIAEQEKAKSETEEIDENSYNAVDAISEEVPAPAKRRKKNRQPVQVEAEKVENTLEAAPIREAVAEPDVVSETESTEEKPMTVEVVEETAVQDDTNVTFDASSLEGKSEKELKDRQSDLYFKDEMQGLTKEEELELDAIKERLGGAKKYKGYEGTKQSDRNKGMSNDLAFSVSPQQRAHTARSRVLGEMMMRVLGRIKGLNVHMVGSQSEALRVLQELNGIIEFDGRIKKDWNSTIASLDAACRKLLLAGPVGLFQSKSGAKVQNISDIRNSLEKLSQTLSENDAFSPEEFIRQLANALNIKDVDSKKTNYQNIKLENGAIISIRNSGHQANALNFILKNNNNIVNIGVVTKYNKELKSVKKDGKKQRTHRFQGDNNVNYVEFVYFSDKTDTAARQKTIVDGVISFLNTESLSGIAKPDRVNVSGKFKDELKITSVEIEQFKAPNGTIYGWATGNDVYLTEEGLNPNTPIHEHTHLWVKALQLSDPKAWKKIVGELKKNKALWESVTKDEAYKDLEGDDAIASEVFARYVGDKGEALLEELAKKQKFGNEKLEEAFINRVKRSLRGFWERVLNLLVKPFGLKYNFKPKNIDEFANLTLRDLFDGKELDVEDTRINEEIESIKQKAIDNGTFMKAPNGQPSNLPEKLWLLVRTKNFKNWFGDWENDPLHASKVVDENGEPMVVYHGTGSAGFETFRLHSESDANTGSRGFFTTENRRVASVYTRDSWTEMPSNAQDVILGADPHEAVYSLFMNMRNPMVVDFADENGNKRHWNEYPTNRWVVAGDEQLGMEDAEFSSEEEANEYLSQFGSSDKPIHIMLTTDDFLRKASEVGFDGCIFKNVYDGNFTMGEEMTDYVALSPNQLKSTNNKGYFSTIDDRIEYQYAEDELTRLDEHAEELIREQEEKGNAIQLDPDLSEQERESWWESVVTRVMDQSNGMRLMLDSINAYRKMKGLEPLDGDKYDVRTKFEACNGIIFNKIGFLERGIQQELDDTIREFAKVVEDSQFYKDHKKEVGGENPTTLTPDEFIERYLIARNNWERAKEGKPRGIAEFKDRMGMGVIEFSNAFTEAYGEKVVLNLWDKIRQMTDFALDTNLEGGLISEEMHAELKAKKFYVPQRGFWDDVNGENDRENEEDILKRRTRGSRTAQNKLDSMHKAEGGKSLAEGCLAYIARDARQAIKLSEENKVKKVMFDLLRDNEDWCHEPEHGFKVPRQAFFYTDENGDIQMMDDGPTPEQVQEMRMLKNIVKQLREEYKRATTEQEREEIAAEIEETESLYPYFDEKDSWRIMHSRVSSQYGKDGLRKNKDAKKAKAIIGLYVNGVPCEIEMTPRFVRVADALNGRRDMRGEFSAIKSVTSWLSAQYTTNNPTFFAVNITRDTPYIITKGATEYGPEFSIRFTANWATSQKAIWKYLITGEIDDTDIGAQLLDFLNNGGNTGYSNLEELQKFRNHVKDLNPGGLERLQRELSTVEGAAKVGKILLAAGKGTAKFGDKLLGWAELRPLAQVLNEWSEIISRFSAYKSVVDMGLGVNEGIKAAHNLSTNFNRKGLGMPFTNFFNSLSVFANAGIQGASGYWRTLKSNDGKALKKVAKTAAYMGMMPAFLGFLSTMLSPDDDDKEYAPSQYERDNYIVIGDMRIALNEQLKPWWCIGVNIAQLLRGRRTLKQATNSVVTSVITNWLPVAQNIKDPISMIVDNATSQEEWNIAQIARTAIMPSAMQSLNQWADNKNFLGGKLRYDIRDTPEYEMAPNEAALYQDLARALYVFGGGNEKVSSKTKDDGTKLRKLWDVNPKEIRSNLFWIPSGALDVFCLGYGIYKDTKEKIEGDYKGTNVRVKDLPIINRFYKPNDNSLYRYAIVREVRAMVKQHNDRISNLEKQTVHFEDVLNKTGDISALESLIETNRLYNDELNDAVYIMLSEILGQYDNISIRSFQNEFGESKMEVELHHGEIVGKMNLSEQELVQLMLQGRNIKKGLKHSKDVPEWIEWFDEHNPLRK